MRLPQLPAGLKPLLPLGIGALVVALLVGVAVGRLLPNTTAQPEGATDTTDSESGGGHSHDGGSTNDKSAPGMTGLSLSSSGLTLVPKNTKMPQSDQPAAWSFTITDTAGDPVTEFATVHDRKLHLFAIRRDLTGFQHLHPKLDRGTGVWTIDIAFDSPGVWRVITDFSAKDGKEATAATLGTDVTVPGGYHPATISEPEASVTTGGFDVTMDFEPALGVSAPALLSVTANGKPAKLDKYLGAYGHLVVLRRHDLGFAHVHPDDERVDSKLRFWATLPSKGTYRAFLDFKVDGKVHTAGFTITA